MAIKPVLLQRRFAEVGRIRCGQLKPGRGGKMYPTKLKELRFTSASRPLLDKIAHTYGGAVAAWTPANGGASQWEVVSTTNRVPILITPMPISQYMELWSGGGCQRRCDGEVERLSGQPCICRAQGRKDCSPHTRMSVMLRDIEGLGVWRLEAHGWDAAAELPLSFQLLRQLGDYVEASLYLRPVRRPVRGRQREWNVPTVEIEGITPGQLRAQAAATNAALAAGSTAAVRASTTASVSPALESSPTPNAAQASAAEPDTRSAAAGEGTGDPAAEPDEFEAIAAAQSISELNAVVQRARAAGSPDLDRIEAAATARRHELINDAQQLWMQIMMAAPEQTTTQLQDTFAARHDGLAVASASPAQLRRFFEDLTAESAQASA